MKRRVIGAVTLGALALPIATALPAAAQDGGNGSTDTTTQPRRGNGQHNQNRQDRRKRISEALAAKLGITVDQLRAAVKEARTHKPDEKITDKKLRREYWQKQLASALGISVDDLKKAEQSVRVDAITERLAKAVSNGRLTQEQADKILADAKAGKFPERRGHRGQGQGRDPRANQQGQTNPQAN